MFLSNASVKRPIAMSCLIIGLTLLGLNSYRKLGLEMMPKIDVPVITIVTTYPGASPSEIETDVAKKIEDKVVSIDGLKHVSSSCMENVCQTMLEFNIDVDVDIAATDVREKIDLIRSDFPADVEDPIIQKFDLNAKAIVTLALAGNAPVDELFDYADNTLKDKLTTIPGVAEVQLVGGAEREVHVELDRDRLAARGLTALNVMQTLQNNLGIIPSGRLRDNGAEYSIKFDADFKDERRIGEMEIANSSGQRCHIRDIGQVNMSTEELRQKATLNGKSAIAIKVIKKADANAVAVAGKIREQLAQVNEELPGGMKLEWVTDDGVFIEATNLSAWENVVEGIMLTAAILFFFLYNFRSLLVVCVTMPLTIIIGLFFMQMLNFTLNTSTLIAIGMSIGILVTNSIVVLEAIIKRLGELGDPKEAAMIGAKESFIAVLASAGTNVVVLFPLAMMSGKVGLFIRPLSLTMFIMTLVSLFISFTLTPMMCSLLLKPGGLDEKSLIARIERKFNSGLDTLIAAYRAMLQFLEKNRWAAILVVIAVVMMLLHSMKLAETVGSGFFNEVDKGELYVKLEYPTRNSLALTDKQVAEVEKRLKDVPEIKYILSTIGKVEGIVGQASEGVYLAQVLLKFSERNERDLTIEDLQQEVRKRLVDYPGAIITVSQPTLIGGQSSEIEMEISGEELTVLDQLAIETKQLCSSINGLRDIDTTVRSGKPEIRIRPKRDVLSDLGSEARNIGMVVRANIEGMDSGTYKRNARNYDIVVKLKENEGWNQVSDYSLPGAPGKPMILKNVGDVEEGLAPIQITRKDKMRVSKILANTTKDIALGNAIKQIDAKIATEGELPPGYKSYQAGNFETMAEAQEAFGEAGLTAIILVILTLAAILESFRQPALILVTLPLALIGVIWALYICGGTLGIFEIMGMVMMVGIVVNNAILIMDQFNVHVAEGVPIHKAMISAACERFRPVVMITLAAVLGMMPLAMTAGIGGEMRNGVGIASVGGILVSGILTLIIMPVLYDLFTKRGVRKEHHN